MYNRKAIAPNFLKISNNPASLANNPASLAKSMLNLIIQRDLPLGEVRVEFRKDVSTKQRIYVIPLFKSPCFAYTT